MTGLVFERASGSTVVASDGRAYTDLVAGFGAVFLGHGHPAVLGALQAQAARVWSSPRHTTPALLALRQRLDTHWLPAGLRFAGLYSTGMEVAEYALRLAVRHTGRSEFAGFAGSMHGKSALTASLGWDNAVLPLAQARRLPFVGQRSEAEVLDLARQLLAPRRLAALFVEPVQGSNGAHEASLAFYDTLVGLCREHGTLCVFDEILTGLHRTGPAFYVEQLAQPPDMLLFAKCLGNGFPVSALALHPGVPERADALPGSTFSGHALAAAVADATLAQMQAQAVAAQVAAVGQVVREALQGTGPWRLQGRGALWALHLPPGTDQPALAQRLLDGGVLVSLLGPVLRLLPAATMDTGQLRAACEVVRQAILRSTP